MLLLNQSQHLAKMIGVWRGRQAEEALAQSYNERLVDALKAMYDTDMTPGEGGNKGLHNDASTWICSTRTHWKRIRCSVMR